MGKRLRSWWQKIIEHPNVIGIVVSPVLLFLLFIFLAYSFGWDWTGFNSGTSQIIITNTSKGNYTATILQPSKSLWDWLGLLAALTIPLVVVLATIAFSWWQAHLADLQHQSDQKLAQQQHEADKQSAQDQQSATILQTYLDNIQGLLLNHNLLGAKPDDKAAILARAQTLTVLEQLDGKRKRRVLQFLHEAKLIHKAKHVFSLSGSDISLTDLQKIHLEFGRLNGAIFDKDDLRGAYLKEADFSGAYLNQANFSGNSFDKANFHDAELKGANLSGTDLSNVNLSGANLHGANLKDASLIGADLRFAKLSGANLRGVRFDGANLSDAIINVEELEKQAKSLNGATMPDGSIHD